MDFLKFLDDPPTRRKSILFVIHGAMSRGLDDKWVMLALIAQAIKGRWGSNQVRAALSRTIGKIMVMTWVERNGTEIWCELLATPPSQWLNLLPKRGIDPEGDNDSQTDDDPVPQAVLGILPSLNTNAIYDALLLTTVPAMRSSGDQRRHDTHRQAAEPLRIVLCRLPGALALAAWDSALARSTKANVSNKRVFMVHCPCKAWSHLQGSVSAT